jgi:hypothetical protein
MRKEFEMSEEDFKSILESCRPVPYIIIGGVPPRSQQENANDAWCALGRKMGFDGMTCEPSGRGDRFFTAEVVEPPPPPPPPDPAMDALREYDHDHGGGR